MTVAVNCDGCGEVIRNGQVATKTRLQLFQVESIDERYAQFRRGATGHNESWDFCSVGCLATWATQRELESAPKSGDTP